MVARSLFYSLSNRKGSDVTDDTYTKSPPPPASVDDSKVKSSIQEWKNIIEEIEKLKANITMLTEEKSELEEKNENSTGNTISIARYSVYFSLEENEKLKVQVSDKDMLIAKLMKKESQLKEELQSMKDTTTAGNKKQLKEREPVKDIGIQFDYIVPSMGFPTKQLNSMSFMSYKHYNT
uniref:Uncharacterized protein n=1 Tax=Amphimedon queenslandica TaxID=400682 RepID=A0A1X7SX95_AMPQE